MKSKGEERVRELGKVEMLASPKTAVMPVPARKAEMSVKRIFEVKTD